MNRRRDWFYDAAAFAALLGVALGVAGFLLRDDLFLLGDHAGHYWLLWYTLNVSAPLHHRLIDWIPFWYAGYPELQFTPPGFVLLGWLLNILTLGKISTALIYEIIVFTGYALPAFTFYYALRHLGFERRVAFSAGLFGLSFPMFFEGAIALMIGMIGSRMAWALSALFFVWMIDCLESRGTQYAILAAITLAAIILMHPYHAVGIAVALGLYVLVRRLSFIASGARLAIVIALACALDAFWLLPLLANSSASMIPVLRATFDQTWAIMVDLSLLPYALLALFAVWRAKSEPRAERRAVTVVLLALPFVLGTLMLADHAILIDRLRLYQIDPVRLVGEYFLPVLWLAAIGLSEISGRVENSFGERTGWGFSIVVSASLLIPLVAVMTTIHPQPNAEPRFLSEATQEYRLDDLWDQLRESPGRILFTSHKTNLTKHGGEPFPTTLTALAPLFTQRPMMGGTYTAWSPIASFVWTGQIRPAVLRGLSDESDDRSLFGVPIEKLSDQQLATFCRRFNITTVVTTANDVHTRTFLDASPLFQSYFNNRFFFVYRVQGYESTWIEARNASVEVVDWQDQEMVLRVRSANEGASVNVKLYAYPLWRATTDTRQSLAITPDEMALMQMALPVGEDYSVTLRYEPGWAELGGGLVSLIGVLGLVAVSIKAWR